jgi:hypothetical protein
MPSKRTEVE